MLGGGSGPPRGWIEVLGGGSGPPGGWIEVLGGGSGQLSPGGGVEPRGCGRMPLGGAQLSPGGGVEPKRCGRMPLGVRSSARVAGESSPGGAGAWGAARG